MEVAAIHLARAMAFVEPIDLNPRGTVFYPDLVRALVARYSFQKFPQKAEDFDETKGVTFAEGKFGNVVVEQLIIYAYGILVDTRVSTQESKRLLEEAIQWGSKELGLAYKPVHRWQYASQLTFHSEIPLAASHSAFRALADGMSKGVSEIMGENIRYELAVVSIDHDQLIRKHPLGRFSIQRRENAPFSENKYFSDAPLPTDMHIRLLERFEADLSK
jgi:hypothetical protein